MSAWLYWFVKVSGLATTDPSPLYSSGPSCRWRSGRPSRTPRTPRSSTSGTCTCTSLSASPASWCSPGCSRADRSHRCPWKSVKSITVSKSCDIVHLISTYRVALPALGSETAFLDVILAVVGRGLKVDQVRVLMVSKFGIFGQQHSPTILPLLLDFMCSIKLLFQHSSDLKVM